MGVGWQMIVECSFRQHQTRKVDGGVSGWPFPTAGAHVVSVPGVEGGRFGRRAGRRPRSNLLSAPN